MMMSVGESCEFALQELPPHTLHNEPDKTIPEVRLRFAMFSLYSCQLFCKEDNRSIISIVAVLMSVKN